jgi:predicted enzyme related to lactoylglutathione lyase
LAARIGEGLEEARSDGRGGWRPGDRVPFRRWQLGSGWIATFADPDDNYFQLISPM